MKPTSHGRRDRGKGGGRQDTRKGDGCTFSLAVNYWLPPLLLMAVIFYLSSLSGLPDFEELDFAMKKTAHFSVYALLYLLLFRAFHSLDPDRARPIGMAGLNAAFVAVLYAVSDEVHQSFVPFRTATVRDVLIDVGGIAFMYALLASGHPAVLKRVLRSPSSPSH